MSLRELNLVIVALAVMTIALNNSARDDYDHHSAATGYLDMSTKRLDAGTSTDREEAKIVDHCFSQWRVRIVDRFDALDAMAMAM